MWNRASCRCEVRSRATADKAAECLALMRTRGLALADTKKKSVMVEESGHTGRSIGGAVDERKSRLTTGFGAPVQTLLRRADDGGGLGTTKAMAGGRRSGGKRSEQTSVGSSSVQFGDR